MAKDDKENNFGRDSEADDGDEGDEKQNQDEPQERGGLFSESIKKLFAVGIGAAFLTEESIRTYIQDLKLPKDALNLLLQSAAKSKEQLLSRVGNEVISIIQKIDFVKEASRFVETHKFKVSAEIEVIKKSGPGESTKSDM